MKRIHTLSMLLVTPTTLRAEAALAYEPDDSYRPRTAADESVIETATELEAPEDASEQGGPWVALGSYWSRTAAGSSNVGFLVSLGWPLDRGGRRLRSVAAPAIAQRSHARTNASSPSAPEVVAIQVSTTLARACVRAAWRAFGMAGDDDLEGIATRARWSSALPEVRIRVARGWDESFRLMPTDSDPYRTQEISGMSRWLEGRLMWRLDRMLFADQELTIERLRMHRAEARSRLAGRVLGTLFDWQRALNAATDPGISTQERAAAVLEQAETEATLDVLTAGWFSRRSADRAFMSSETQ